MSVSTALRSRAGLFAVSGGALLWGTTGVAVRVIHDRSGLSAVSIGCYRLIIATLALGVFFGRGGPSRIRTAFGRHRWWLVLAGALLGIYQALYFIGVQYVGVSVSTLTSIAVAPVTVTAVTAIRGRRRPSMVQLVTLTLALVGLALISLSTHPSSQAFPHPVLGILASVGSGLGYAAATLVNRRLAVDGDPLVLTAATCGIGALVLLPLALGLGMTPTADLTVGWWLVYIGLFPTVVAYGLYYLGMRSTAPEVAAVLTLLEPLAATVLAGLILHESLAPLGLLGALLMMVGIAAMYLRTAEPDAPPH